MGIVNPGGVPLAGRLKGNMLREAQPGGKQCKATSSVAAHSGHGSIGIEIMHGIIGMFRYPKNEYSVGPDARVAMAQCRGVVSNGFGQVGRISAVKDDEVVSGAMHFAESKGYRHERDFFTGYLQLIGSDWAGMCLQG